MICKERETQVERLEEKRECKIVFRFSEEALKKKKKCKEFSHTLRYGFTSVRGSDELSPHLDTLQFFIEFNLFI